MNLAEFFHDYISTWEGGLSLDPDDSGNWFIAKGCAPVLVGSNYGVTGAALAAFRGRTSVTAADIKALTLDEAARIGERLYYDLPNLDLLPWDQLVASVVDFGWGAGPKQAIKLLQRMIGVADDGEIGPYTVRAYRQFVASHGIKAAADEWRDVRSAFYRQIVRKRPVNAKYLHGWLRRSDYFQPGGGWWLRFTRKPAAAA